MDLADPNDESGLRLVRITARSEFGDLDQARPFYTASDSIKAEFPGDLFFDHVEALSDPILWGRPDEIE